ncbi:D-3-phosphoglycerate dehydrogenase [Neorhodopirellula lusitana]|uniref:D-3-phosphoglycerate dehydrogenase n=1 Tax=Neorhodopirellula lusitana TaxID=445327 RepID=A0ABY1PZ99_9BACT|nr:phosphoglycerate dehydrogenase [Neorhodopirellula lusitana]SMP52851.1 D-3-phosphoglycerate dehydrogenase [Neorhodopirellula lusitana]
MHRILVLDDIAQEGIDLLQATEGVEYEVRTKLKGEELRSALNEFDAAILRSGVTITAESLEGNTRLRALARAGVGTDNIDKPAATRRGIVVMNTPAGNTVSTAEHTFAMLLAMSRNLAPANQSLVEGRWDRKKFMGNQVAGKTLGIVGMGRIGREVASRARAFDMNIVAFDPFLTDDQAEALMVKRVETVDEMLPMIDYLTVHTPLTPETKGLIGVAQLEKVKPGLRVINVARGGIYDHDALVEGLKSGKLGGVALDVYENEPCTDSPLFGMPGTICTPHLGASTEEAQTQVAVEGIHLLINYLKTGEIRHSVNVASLDPKTLDELRSYLNISHRLGLLLHQWHGGGIDQVCITYRGAVAGKDTRVLNNAFCAGLLERVVEDANVINSEMLLRERGIELKVEHNSEQGAFTSSITVQVSGSGKTAQAGAAVLGHEMPRLILLDGYRLESFLDGRLFVFSHQDVPGMIGHVGTIFGNHGINIAQMAVGREGNAPGGQAIGVLSLDGDVSEATMKELQAIDAITCAKVIELPKAGELPSWMS